MVKFIEVDPNEIENIRYGRRGRISYPLLKGFLETGMFVAQLDLTGIQQSKQSLTSSLTAYIKSHNLPIKLLQRNGIMYLMRLDIDEDGNAIPDWDAPMRNPEAEIFEDAVDIDDDEIARRFEQEENQTTK